MTKPINNYLKILSYLKQYEGDGLLHNVEEVLEVNNQQKRSVLSELSKEGLITLVGGHDSTRISFGWDGKTFGGDYIPAEAKITIKGSKYLKEELEMIENKVNIHVGDNSIANFILHSPSSTIHNKVEYQKKIDEIIETLQVDSAIDSSTRELAVSTFNALRTEIQVGNPTTDTLNKVLTIGASIASIGSLVLALVQQFAK